jgi:hypothetical protein
VIREKKTMRRLLIAGAASLGLMLGGCTSLQSILTDITSGQAATIISQVQAFVAQACHVEPDAVDIITLWNATWGATAAVIGGEICAAVGPAPVAAKFHKGKFGAVWTPRPVVINGNVVHFD